VDALSFTAGTDDRLYAAARTGLGSGFANTLRDIVASSDTTMLEPDNDAGAIGSASNTGDTIAVIVNVDPVRAAPRWRVIEGIGAFSGFFIINCNGSGRREWLGID
jgi:hypothetical protein